MRLPNCPNEFKILVSDRITSYHAYKAAHAALFTAKTPEQCTTAAQEVLRNYRLNRQIWAELHHYQNTNTILGKHPIFAVHTFMEEIKTLPLPEVILKRNALYKSITVAQKQLRQNAEPHLATKRQTLIQDKTPLLIAVENYLKTL